MAKKNTTRNVAIGAALAGAVGYLAGILTAPKSGQETRKDIADKAGDLKDDAAEKLSAAIGELESTLEAAKSKTLQLSSKAKAEFNEAVLRAKDAREKAVVVLKAVRAGEADDPELNKAVKQAKQATKNLSKFLKN